MSLPPFKRTAMAHTICVVMLYLMPFQQYMSHIAPAIFFLASMFFARNLSSVEIEMVAVT